MLTRIQPACSHRLLCRSFSLRYSVGVRLSFYRVGKFDEHRGTMITSPQTQWKRRLMTHNKNVALKSHHGNTEVFRIERLARNPTERAILLDRILSDDLTKEDIADIYNIFRWALDSVGAEVRTDYRLYLVCDIWDCVFRPFNGRLKLTSLQRKLLTQRKTLVHLLIDFRHYGIYQALMGPLFDRQILEEPEWYDVLARTLQFSITDKNKTTFNQKAITSFLLSDSVPVHEKRVMVASFVRRGMQFKGDEWSIITNFFKFMALFEDNHLLLRSTHHKQYKNAMLSISRFLNDLPDTPIQKLEKVFVSVNSSPKTFFDFLSSLIQMSSKGIPTAAIRFWEYKTKFPDRLKYIDLTNIMIAYLELRDFDKIMALSKKFPKLYNDEQLVILLKVSQSRNDWKTLQDQFDDMYGKGRLPYEEHYSVVMNALAQLGAKQDVDRLYAQLQARKIKQTPNIFRALIMSRIAVGEFEEAKAIFELYLRKGPGPKLNLKDLQEGELHRMIFGVHLRFSSRQEVFQFIQDTAQRQNKEDLNLIDSRMIVLAIEYFIDCYGFKQVQYLHELAESFDLLDETVYARLGKAYTLFSQYSMAEKLLSEAHHVSLVTFQNPLILKAQLHNYTLWYQNTTDFSEKSYIWHSRYRLLKLAKDGNLPNYYKSNFYSEIIKYFVSRDMIGVATMYLTNIQKYGTYLTEDMYVPFMKHYSKSSDLTHHEKVLQYYKEMVSLNLKITSKTYEQLFKSVLYLDGNNNDFHNSDKLLHSVLELHQLDLGDLKPKVRRSKSGYDVEVPRSSVTKDSKSTRKIKPDQKVINEDLRRAAESLCKMVCSYLHVKPGTSTDKSAFLVSFLNKLKLQLGPQMKYSARLTIIEETSKLYLKFRNMPVARSLVTNGLQEFDSILSEYHKEYPLPHEYAFEVQIPKSLQIGYATIMGMNISLLKQDKVSEDQYLDIAHQCERLNVKLSGESLNFLVDQLMKLDDWKGLHSVLYIVDTHLAMGTLNEGSFRKYMARLYKLFSLIRKESLAGTGLPATYRIFNEFYGAENFAAIKKTFKRKTDLKRKFKGLLLHLNHRYYNMMHWSYDYVMKNPEIFFSPEKRLGTPNQIGGMTLSKLVTYVINYCRGDKYKLFELYEKYPSAIECVFQKVYWSPRFSEFRREIDLIIEPPQDKAESFNERRERTSKALRRLFDR